MSESDKPTQQNEVPDGRAWIPEDKRPTPHFPCLFRVDQRVWLKIPGQRGFWGPMIIIKAQQTVDRLNWEYKLRFHTDADELYKGGAWVSQKDLDAKGAGKNSQPKEPPAEE